MDLNCYFTNFLQQFYILKFSINKLILDRNINYLFHPFQIPKNKILKSFGKLSIFI